MTAFSPLNAKLEPMDLTEDGKVYELSTETQVSRYHEGERGPGPLLLQDLTRLGAPEAQKVLEDSSELFYSEPGLVFFEDGSYSRGPVCVDGSVDGQRGAEEENSITDTVETCLAFPGEQRRVRIFQTIQFSLEEPEEEEEGTEERGDDIEDDARGWPSCEDLDEDDKLMRIQLLQVRMVEEKWAGPLDLSLGPTVLAPAQPRASLQDQAGTWCSFRTQVTPIEGDEEARESVLEGEPEVPLSYETSEVKEEWQLANEFYPPDNCSVLCLPDGVTAFVTLGQTETCPPLSIGISWNISKKFQMQLSREYDADGQLALVRLSSAIREKAHKGFKR
uniref:Uncharacterized protein n=1 Tax=Polyblepharides amylifera TaxID=1486889 RepID=A0A7R9XNF3_9CHLO|mmetsp:Transcript_583/g.827  ORF Transcript_583/g.827 Transcript_583/m.827 type:complete len:334 (+) Transcript_583:277-1278(+)